MDLTGQRHLSIDRGAAFAALNDPAVLKDCIPGCEAIERTGENQYVITIAAALGPVRASFRGKLEVEDAIPPESYTLRFEGQGGAAGFAKGMAKVRLVEDNGTRMEYSVNVQVGGKLAQVGNRLIDSAARKLSEEFFTAFEKRVATAPAPASPAATPTAPALSGTRYAWILVIAIAIIAVLVMLRH
jgi:carbon monoxide dehydrogenase subunit G